jgi:ribosomal-protein-alanine N-acetyltransferase
VREPIETELPVPSALPAIQFRRMEADDLPRVMQIEGDAFAHPWSEDLFRRELTHTWSTILIATGAARTGATGLQVGAQPDNGHVGHQGSHGILGFVICWRVHDELHVLNLAVAVEARRRGVARALMLEATEQARRSGAVLATLEVRRSNEGALSLYRSLGYRQVGIRPNYYQDEGEDAIVMVVDI